MRKLSFFVLLLVSSSNGCCGTHARTGWRFEVLRPPTLATEALVQSGSPSLGIIGSGCGGLRSEVASLQPLGALPPLPSAPLSAEQAASFHFALFGILQRLEALERQTAPTMQPANGAAPTPKSACPAR